MDITNLDANVWQYFFAFMEHNKIFTLILVFMAAVFLLLIKKIVKIPCNIFTGKIDSTKMMLSEWEKDNLCIYAVLNAIEFDLEQASASFNGDLAGIKIDGYTIKGGHHGTEKN